MADQTENEELELQLANQRRRIEALEEQVKRLADEVSRMPAKMGDMMRRRG